MERPPGRTVSEILKSWMAKGYRAAEKGGRMSHPWTQAALSKEIGDHQGQISKWLNGTVPDDANINKLIYVLFGYGQMFLAEIAEFRAAAEDQREGRKKPGRPKAVNIDDRLYDDHSPWKIGYDPTDEMGQLLDLLISKPDDQGAGDPSDFPLMLSVNPGTKDEVYGGVPWDVGFVRIKVTLNLKNCLIAKDLTWKMSNVIRGARAWTFIKSPGDELLMGDQFDQKNPYPARMSWVTPNRLLEIEAVAECMETDISANVRAGYVNDAEIDIGVNKKAVATRLIQKLKAEEAGEPIFLGKAGLRWEPKK